MEDRTRKLAKLMKFLAATFEEEGLKYWLDFGSLLGMVRNGKLIEHDHDVEMSIFEEDLPKLVALREKIRKQKYKLDYKDLSVEHPKWKWPQIRLPKSKELDVEIMAYRAWPPRDGDESKCVKVRGYSARHRALIAPREFFAELDSIEYEGVNIAIPSKVEEYLHLRYGPNWKTPNPNFYRDGYKIGSKVYHMRVELLVDYLVKN